MSYVDGVIIPVPNANRDAYVAYAKDMATLFKEFGATRIVDCWGDDVPEGELTSFGLAVKREPNESVVFSWISWPSREVRDEGWKKLMADPRMQRRRDAALRWQADDLRRVPGARRPLAGLASPGLPERDTGQARPRRQPSRAAVAACSA